MKVKFNCPACDFLIEVEAQPMPIEDCDGRSGFYSIEATCKNCGHETETVIRER